MSQTKHRAISLWRVLLKAGLLFIILNVLFALLNPLPAIEELSVYNTLVPGRHRLPYGEDPRSYNLSLNSIAAMFASHEVAQPKPEREFRLFIIGDSSVWGVLLKPEETLASQLNNQQITLEDGRTVRAYNLGHPVLSLTKDLLLLDHAMQYKPDMILWLTTLRSFPRDKQFFAPLVQNNAEHVRALFETHDLDYNLQDAQLVDLSFLDQTIVGQRRAVADWLRLQLYGVMWKTTGIDQFYPNEITLRTSEFDEDITWDDITTPRELTPDDLAFDIIETGLKIADQIPVLLVNEPIFIGEGRNSDLRYNLWYPRWAYDSYRDLYQNMAQQRGWNYLDLWDLIVPAKFTDSPVHLTPAGTARLAQQLALINMEKTTPDE